MRDTLGNVETEALVVALRHKLAEVESETLRHTLADMMTEALNDALADTLAEVDAKTIGGTLRHLEAAKLLTRRQTRYQR